MEDCVVNVLAARRIGLGQVCAEDPPQAFVGLDASAGSALERAAPFRLDFGFADEGLEVTARFGLNF